MPSATELKQLFSKKYATLTEPQKEKFVYNPGEDQKPLTWKDIKNDIDENPVALQALYRANIIKR